MIFVIRMIKISMDAIMQKIKCYKTERTTPQPSMPLNATPQPSMPLNATPQRQRSMPLNAGKQAQISKINQILTALINPFSVADAQTEQRRTNN